MAQISLPNQLVNGTVADASQVMANFNAIVDVVNGNLGSDNIKSISGNDITLRDTISGGTDTLNNFAQRIQVGHLSTGDFPAKERKRIQVKFNTPFPGTPYVVAQTSSSYPERRYVGIAARSKNGFEVVCYKTQGSSSNYAVMWIAIYTGAM